MTFPARTSRQKDSWLRVPQWPWRDIEFMLKASGADKGAVRSMRRFLIEASHQAEKHA